MNEVIRTSGTDSKTPSVYMRKFFIKSPILMVLIKHGNRRVFRFMLFQQNEKIISTDFVDAIKSAQSMTNEYCTKKKTACKSNIKDYLLKVI